MADDAPPPAPLLLTEASVQEIQLELIRRRRFNRFDGGRVVASLRRHRGLWRACLFRSDGLPPKAGADLGYMSLFNLRDIPENRWNADRLYVLCDTAERARAVLDLAAADRWRADATAVHDAAETVSSALADATPAAVAELWWD